MQWEIHDKSVVAEKLAGLYLDQLVQQTPGGTSQERHLDGSALAAFGAWCRTQGANETKVSARPSAS